MHMSGFVSILLVVALEPREQVQWSAWMRRTRQDPPTLQELQQDISRRQRLQSNVQRLQQAYTEEKLALQAEAERVAQLNAPTTSNIKNKKQEEMENAPYPSQSNPSVVPTIVAETGHPPLQEFGANVPKAKPHEGVFPGMAEDSPERQTMAAALDDAADRTMGREEKERQIRQGRVEPGACFRQFEFLVLYEARRDEHGND